MAGGARVRGLVTTALDVIGLALVAAGAAAAAYPVIGWACLVVAGVVLLAGSVFATWVGGRL